LLVLHLRGGIFAVAAGVFFFYSVGLLLQPSLPNLFITNVCFYSFNFMTLCVHNF